MTSPSTFHLQGKEVPFDRGIELIGDEAKTHGKKYMQLAQSKSTNQNKKYE